MSVVIKPTGDQPILVWVDLSDTPALAVTHGLLSAAALSVLRSGIETSFCRVRMITVTAHIYADLYDDGLDDVASALDALDDSRGDLP